MEEDLLDQWEVFAEIILDDFQTSTWDGVHEQALEEALQKPEWIVFQIKKGSRQ